MQHPVEALGAWTARGFFFVAVKVFSSQRDKIGPCVVSPIPLEILTIAPARLEQNQS
jgi:hypothetical protein